MTASATGSTLPAVGSPAPDFTLPSTAGTDVTLSSLRGKKVLIAFCPLAFTSTCTTELLCFTEDFGAFQVADTVVLPISVDSIPSKIAWQKKEIGLMHTPMCADFYPHGEVSERFGILRKEQPFPGICERAVFIVDKKGKIAFARIYPLDQAPNNEKLLAAWKKIGAQG